MEHVARVAGVSKATVSRVLSNSPRISQKTRTRVLEAVRSLSYEPNYIARSLSKRTTHSIGVVLEDIMNPFYTQVAKGIETVLKAGGYTMVLTSSGFVCEEELELTRTLLRYKVDGILLTPVEADSLAVSILKSRGVPFFMLNAKSEDPAISWIDSDNRLGGYMAARYLLNLGHRVKMVPSIEVFHKAPFGMRHGRRSLYYHVRNFWLWAFKYLPWSKVLAFPFVFLKKGLGGKKQGRGGEVTDAVGTIGLFDNIRAVPGGYWICTKATLAALWNLPYCLRRRQVCRHPDFDLPIR